MAGLIREVMEPLLEGENKKCFYDNPTNLLDENFSPNINKSNEH